jgi:hypothetical protein
MNNELATYKVRIDKAHQVAIKAVTGNNIDLAEARKALCQYQHYIMENPEPDLLPAPAVNTHIDKYISSNYFWLIGVCKSIDKANPLLLLVVAPDCMAHILSFLEPTSLFPKLFPCTESAYDDEVKSKTELIGDMTASLVVQG